MNRAIDVAKYIINYANDNRKTISNLKLQKLLYYIQAAFLVESNGKDICFNEIIWACLHGPIVRSVYSEFTVFGGEQIMKQKYTRKIVYKNHRFTFENILFSKELFSIQDRKIIENVLSKLIDYDAWYLVNKTREESPWIEAGNGEIITPEKIYAYFSENENKKRIYGEQEVT